MRLLAIILLPLVTFWLVLANWAYPVLRLASGAASLRYAVVLLVLPLVTAGMALARLAGRVRWFVLTLVVPTILVAGVIVFMAGAPPETGGKLTPVRRVPLPGGGALVVYRANYCVTCDFDVVLRQERRLVSGLLLVRDLYGRRHAEDADVELTAPDRVRVGDEDLRLRRWVYF